MSRHLCAQTTFVFDAPSAFPVRHQRDHLRIGQVSVEHRYVTVLLLNAREKNL